MKNNPYRRRILLLLFLMMVSFAIFIVRLASIQLVEGEELARWAVRQRSQGIVLGHDRGDIQDRNENSLLNGEVKEALVAFPSLYRGNEDYLHNSVPYKHVLNRIEHPPHDGFPFIVDHGEPGTFSFIDDNYLPGLVRAEKVRRYGEEVIAPHVVGHIQSSDGIGRLGLELHFEEYLSGSNPPVLAAYVDGKERLVDGLGIKVREGGKESRGAYNVVTTLDKQLQKYVQNLLTQNMQQGAVVVMEPGTGDILAMASTPHYHPGKVEDYLNSMEGSFHNRAILPYHPGSIFKILIAAAALEEDIADIHREFTCTGLLELNEGQVRCSHFHPEENVNLTEAFAYSCNTVFIKLGLELGAATLEEYASRMGLGKNCGLPLNEKEGFIPGEEQIINEAGMANTALGQEMVEVTPLQVARMMAVIARGGEMIMPRIVDRTTDNQGRVVENFPPETGRRVLSDSTVNKLKYLLHAVTESGTGRNAANPEFMVGGKTGTAQSGRSTSEDPEEEIYYHWFAGLSPLENTRAVIVVFSEGESALLPAEIFQRISTFRQ